MHGSDVVVMNIFNNVRNPYQKINSQWQKTVHFGHSFRMFLSSFSNYVLNTTFLSRKSFAAQSS